jgi:hypothetical protein
MGRPSQRPHKENLEFRKVAGQALRPTVIARAQVPLMVTAFERLLGNALDRGGEVKFAVLARRMTYEVALRSTMGDLFTDEEVEHWYSDYDAYIRGMFAPVRAPTKGRFPVVFFLCGARGVAIIRWEKI